MNINVSVLHTPLESLLQLTLVQLNLDVTKNCTCHNFFPIEHNKFLASWQTQFCRYFNVTKCLATREKTWGQFCEWKNAKKFCQNFSWMRPQMCQHVQCKSLVRLEVNLSPPQAGQECRERSLYCLPLGEHHGKAITIADSAINLKLFLINQIVATSVRATVESL